MTRTKASVRNAPRRKSALQSASRVLSDKSDFVQEFRALGFTDYEAKAYLVLCQSSPATAYEVSKLAGLPKANVYAALDGLAQRGAVQPVSEDPVKYVPVEPARLLGQIAKTTSARCKDLVDKLSRAVPAQGTDYVWTLKGEESIHLKIGEMIDRARQHVWIKAPEELIERHSVALRRAAKRGVRTLIVLFGTAESVARYTFGSGSRAYLHEGSGVMIGPARELITVAIDFDETLMANLGEAAHGAFTRSSPVVYMAESLIRHEVYLAEIFDRFGAEIEDAFGPALVRLRERYLKSEHVADLRQKLAAR